mmetsp:Transcript_44681/g.95082  ORF Transcript_44681/g.95082 Transcript_44681/m.95082 type:complete len:274 (-) Transcript_44681:113-934(-)
MQSWETRRGRSLRVVGLARPGEVAFFSYLGSSMGLSSASSCTSSLSQNPGPAISMALSAHLSASSAPSLPACVSFLLHSSLRLSDAQAGSLNNRLSLSAARAWASRSARCLTVASSSSRGSCSTYTSLGPLSSQSSSSLNSSWAKETFCSLRVILAMGPRVARGRRSALRAVKYSFSPRLRRCTESSRSMRRLRSATPPSSYPSSPRTLKPVPGRAGLSRGLADPTSSSGFGGGGGNDDLSILRSRAFFCPAFDFAFLPMINCGYYCVRLKRD